MQCNHTCELRLANAEDVGEIFRLVQTTIRACYAGCYTQSVVEGFCRYHSSESIAVDVAEGKVHVLANGGRIVGTATLDGSYIGRVYVLPEEQGHGYGTLLMDALEKLVASAGSATVTLESSIPGKRLYVQRGYVVVKSETWDIEPFDELPADRLDYDIMEKHIASVPVA